MQPLNSKLIDAFSYDEASRKLVLFMANGHRREYEEVPAGTVNGLVTAKSPGSFYFTAIRGKFPGN